MKDSLHPKKVAYFFIGLVFTFVSLAPDITFATTYYVAKAGHDSNPGTEQSPFRNIKHGVSKLSAGDTLYVKAGTYLESVLSWQTTIPNGTSWNNPVKVAANPGDTVTIHPPAGQAFFWVQDRQAKYLIIDGFIIDGQNSAAHGFKFSNNSRYIRVQNSEIKNAKLSGILATICSGCANPESAPHDTYHEFKNLHVHHNGTTSKDHGFYIETSYNLVESCDVHHNSGNGGKFFSGHKTFDGAKVLSANYNVARYNTLHDNSQQSPPDGWTFGWLLASGIENEAYGNIAYNNNIGFATGNGATDAKLYNNVSYDNHLYGILVYGNWGGSNDTKVYCNTVYQNVLYGIAVKNDAADTLVRNNISYGNGPDSSRNIWLEIGASPRTVSSHNYVKDPKFIDPASKDFRLQASSPAINEGTIIPEISIDIDRNTRPQGPSFDIGAYEFVTSTDNTAPETPIGVGVF